MSRKKKKKRGQSHGRPPKRGRPPKVKVPRIGSLEGVTVVQSPAGEQKMSEVLLEFLEPYSEHWVSQERFEKVVTVGVIAWNAALLPKSEREDFIQQMVQTVPADVRSDMRGILAEMIRRKELLFASNKRMIVSFEVAMTPAGPHLSVMSTFDKL